MPDSTSRPLVQYQDTVGVDHAGKAVRDAQGGTALNQPVKGLDDYRLVLRVHAGQGLVQYEDGRVLEQGAGNGDALLLPAGQPHGPLAYDSVVAVGQVADKIVGVGGTGRFLKLRLRSVRVPEPQVLGNGTVEQVGILGDHRNLFAQLVQGYVYAGPVRPS